MDAKLQETVDFLRTIVIFKGLSTRTLRKIALIVFEKRYSDGEIIYEPNKNADVFYIVKEGLVRVSNESSEKILNAGEFFGLSAFFSGKNHDTLARAGKNSTLFLIYRVRLNDVISPTSKSGVKLMNNIVGLLLLKIKSLEI
jgi:CRP-like cAMP-binding protein